MLIYIVCTRIILYKTTNKIHIDRIQPQNFTMEKVTELLHLILVRRPKNNVTELQSIHI